MGCSSADMLRDLTLNLVNGKELKQDIVAVLKVDPEDQDSIIIESPRFPELNDSGLLGLVASKDKPKPSFVYLPYMDEEHEQGLFVKEWPESHVTGEIIIKKTDTKEELAGVGF